MNTKPADFFERIDDLDRFKETLHARQGNSSGITHSDCLSDTAGKSISDYLALEQTCLSLVPGIIIESVPLNQCYKVSLGGSTLPITCTAMQLSGGGELTLVDSSFYAVGSNVIVAADMSRHTGHIIGLISNWRSASTYNIRQPLDGSFRLYPDPTDIGIQANANGDDIGAIDGSTGTSYNSTDIGEFCKLGYTGTKLFVDPFMAILAANDYTGLWLFEADQLTRLSGVNLQIRSTGNETYQLIDNKEYIGYSGSVLYPWEQMGHVSFPNDKLVLYKPKREWFREGSTTYFVEPSDVKLKPFHRYYALSGWLGQGKQSNIVLPPKKSTVLFDDKDTLPCLSRVTQGVDGLVSVESSKGILITKRGMFPGGSRTHLPDDPYKKQGDNSENYDPDKLSLPKDFPNTGDHKGATRAATLVDYVGYNLNWKNVFPIAYHTKDYELPEESKMEHPTIQVPDFAQLKSSMFISDAEEYTQDIDYKRKEHKFYPTEAGIAILPEGGIVIYDGYGGEIRMVGGSITLSAPGDINIKPGRNAMTWAGKDVLVRGKQNVEMSATDGEFRAKAEKHLELIGGNGGSGAVIIESKGRGVTYDFTKVGSETQANGIVMKAKASTISSLGQQIYVRSGVDGAGGGIMLDAKKGADTIYTVSNTVEEFVKDKHNFQFFTSEMDTVECTSSMASKANYFNGDTAVTGNLITNKNVLIGESVTALTVYMSPTGGHIGKTLKSKEELKMDIDAIMQIPEETYPQISNEEVYPVVIKPAFYDDNRIGNDVVLVSAGFSFRNKDQYAPPEPFVVYEDRWQTLASNSGATLDTWSEKPVAAYTEETYPFPGKPYYTETIGYQTQELKIVDLSNNCYKDRLDNHDQPTQPTDPYNNPQVGKQEQVSLSSYVII